MNNETIVYHNINLFCFNRFNRFNRFNIMDKNDLNKSIESNESNESIGSNEPKVCPNAPKKPNNGHISRMELSDENTKVVKKLTF